MTDSPSTMIEAIEDFLDLVLHRPSPALADLARSLDDLAAVTHRAPPGDVPATSPIRRGKTTRPPMH